MTNRSDAEIADRITRTRSRLIIVSTILFIALQAVYFSENNAPERAVDQVRIGAWLVWTLVLMMLLATGGGLVRSKAVRALINDESTRAHRADAFRFGFWAAMATGVTLYFITLFETVTGREAVHLVLTAGVGAALLRFGVLERRASLDG